MKRCSEKGCKGIHYALGLCKKHYLKRPEVKQRRKKYYKKKKDFEGIPDRTQELLAMKRDLQYQLNSVLKELREIEIRKMTQEIEK